MVGGVDQFADSSLGDILFDILVGDQEVFELTVEDVFVVGVVVEVAEMLVAKCIDKESCDTILCAAFELSDVHSSRVLPVRSSCIMPCLRRLVLSQRV